MEKTKLGKKELRNGVKIAQLQAKDLLEPKEELFNYRGSLDYSLDLLNLQNVYISKCRNSKCFTIDENGLVYTNQVVSVKFDYTSEDKSKKELRTYIYKNGFNIGKIHYVRWKRSSGSARVGKCLFINKELYSAIKKIDSFGIKLRKDTMIDLASYEAYISLISSSLIDTLRIEPTGILVVDDIEYTFNARVNVIDNNLNCSEQIKKITNNVTDGESLIDISAMGNYKDKGMLLLRNHFFKSCAFNCNIQQWFSDNGITDISQLNGYTLAQKVEDIKLITTASSIKYAKFKSVPEWLDRLNKTVKGKDGTEYKPYSIFGICKHEKETHFDNGTKVQTHYQLLNSLRMTEKECKELLQDSIDKFMRMNVNDYIPVDSDKEIVFELKKEFPDIVYTDYYRKIKQKMNRAFKDRLYNGHILVNGNYSTILSAPIEYLQSAIKCPRINYKSLTGNQIVSKRFNHNTTILACRSPHISASNIYLVENVEDEIIDKYVNLTNEIVVINATDNEVMDRLGGCDFDSDSILLTDNKTLIESAQRNKGKFLVPVFLSENDKKIKYYPTLESLAELDFKTSENKIGDIVNLSQKLNSIMWDELSKDSDYDYSDIYKDISILSTLSGIEIDKAKKQVDIDVSKIIRGMNKKYSKYPLPMFFKEIFKEIKQDEDMVQKQIGKAKKENDADELEKLLDKKEKLKNRYQEYNTSMDFIYTIVKKEIDARKYRNGKPIKKDLSKVLISLSPDATGIKVYKRTFDKLNQEIKAYNTLNDELFNGFGAKSKEERVEIVKIQQNNKTILLNKLNKYKNINGLVWMFIKESERRKDKEEKQYNNFVLNTLLEQVKYVKNAQKIA